MFKGRYSNMLDEGVATGPASISYPFGQFGDKDSMVISQDYFIIPESYKPAILNEELNIPNDIKTPFDPTIEIPKLYRVTDVKKGFENKLLRFAKRWANLPKDRSNVFSGSSSFPFPSFQSVVYNPPATADVAEEADNLWSFVETRGSNGSPAPLYIDYKYFFSADEPTIPEVFRPTFNGGVVDFVTDGGTRILQNAKALNGDTFSKTYTVPASSPTLAAYLTKMSEGDFLNIDVQIDRYLGDIFEMRTLKMKAK